MSTYKYNSKYSKMTEEERKEIKKTYMSNYYKKYYQMHRSETSRVGAGRPKKYTEEEALEKIRESKRNYARRKAEERKAIE